MNMLSREVVEATLARLVDPHLNLDPVTAGCVSSIEIQSSQVRVCLVLPYPAAHFKSVWVEQVRKALEQLEGVTHAIVTVETRIKAHHALAQIPALAQVKNIIAVASGKGGVGKSTTAANLALALAAEGARVGVLDADIYGPSQGVLFGLPEGSRPNVKDQKWFVPLERYGIQLMSMAFLVDDNTPMVWRGPVVSGALLQLINQTAWDNLDYLFVDMPPGTGDVQLTLAQKVPVSGAVIVTTPQDLALLDARKGIEMFSKVNIPILGVIENMATHVCSACGHIEHLFGEGGGRKLAAQYNVTLLGSLPLSLDIRMQADAGRPTVIFSPEDAISQVYYTMARTLAARLEQAGDVWDTPLIEELDD